MQDMVTDGKQQFFLHARKNMPKDKEILELDEYIDLMLKTSYDTQNAAGLIDAKERLMAVKNARSEYVSPVFEVFTGYEKEARASQEMHDRLKEIFARQEEMMFLQNNCRVSSAFLNDGFLGCPNCYKVFEKEIQNYIHSTQASSNHIGKAYFMVGENDKNKLIHLEQELKLAINEQRFEDCLNLKNQIDKIKEKLNG